LPTETKGKATWRTSKAGLSCAKAVVPHRAASKIKDNFFITLQIKDFLSLSHPTLEWF
jgi:hypothetical protein